MEEERVVPAAREHDDLATGEDGALARYDHDVALGHDRHVGNIVSVRSGAKAREHGAMPREISSDEEWERMGSLRPAEGGAQRDRLCNASVASELLDVPTCHEPAEAVTDEVDAAARGYVLDQA